MPGVSTPLFALFLSACTARFCHSTRGSVKRAGVAVQAGGIQRRSEPVLVRSAQPVSALPAGDAASALDGLCGGERSLCDLRRGLLQAYLLLCGPGGQGIAKDFLVWYNF